MHIHQGVEVGRGGLRERGVEREREQRGKGWGWG